MQLYIKKNKNKINNVHCESLNDVKYSMLMAAKVGGIYQNSKYICQSFIRYGTFPDAYELSCK